MKNHFVRLIAFTFFLSGITLLSNAQITYYLKSTGGSALTTLSNWGTNTDGTGTAPANFTTGSRIYVITNVATASLSSGTWTVSGTGSKVVLGSTLNTATTFTISGTGSLVATIDIVNATSGMNALVLQNVNTPTFGSLSSNSLVSYAYTGISQQVIKGGITYGNITVEGNTSASKYPDAAFNATGTFTYNNTSTGPFYLNTSSTVKNYSFGNLVILAGKVDAGIMNVISSPYYASVITITGSLRIDALGLLTCSAATYHRYSVLFTGTGTINIASPATNIHYQWAVTTLKSTANITLLNNWYTTSSLVPPDNTTFLTLSSGAILDAGIYQISVDNSQDADSKTRAGNIFVSSSATIRTASPDGFNGLSGSTIYNNATGYNTTCQLTTTSTVEYYSSSAQKVTPNSASCYGNLLSTNTGDRQLMNTGTICISGTFTPGTNAYTVTGSTVRFLNTTSSQNIPAFKFYNVNFEGGVKYINGTDSVVNTLALVTNTPATQLVLNADIRLLSTQTNTANIASIGTGTISYGAGRFIVERFIHNATPTIRTWRFLTAPLQAADTLSINAAWQEGTVNSERTNPNATNPKPGYGTHITGPGGAYNESAGFDQGTNSNSIKYYTSTGWVCPSNTKSTTLMSKLGWGLFVRGDRSIVISNTFTTPNSTTLEPRGKINTGDVTYTSQITAAKVNLIGNPYPCQINMTNVSIGGAIHQQFKLWDPKAYTNYASTGKFIPFTWVSGTTYAASNSPVTVWSSPGTVESGEAFFATPATANVVFHETDKVSGANTLNGIQSRPATGANTSSFNAVSFFRTGLGYYDTNASAFMNIDGTLNLFGQDYNDSVDEYEDAVSPVSGSTTGAIRLLKDGYQLAISKEKDITSADTVFLYLSPLKQAKHQLTFTFADFNPNVTATLLDDYLKTSVPVAVSDTDTTKYDFEITADAASNAPNRFMVAFRSNGVLPVRFNAVSVNDGADNSVLVEWNVGDELNIKRYEVLRSADGKNFTTIGTVYARGESAYHFADNNYRPGQNFYRIKTVSENGDILYSQVVKKSSGNTNSGITVFPNPVKNGTINLQFQNRKPGEHQLQLYNQSGQLMFIKKISVPADNSSVSVQMGKVLPCGEYQISITGPEGEKYFQQVIVE